MSFHMHLRAVPQSDIQPDGKWLSTFMRNSWRDSQEEFTAGIATAVEKDFDEVNHLYTGSADGTGDPNAPATLPVFGGTTIDSEVGPPFLIMTPLQVKQAAAFLEAASFEDLWTASKDGIFGPLGSFMYEAEAEAIFLQHHNDLLSFYRQAAGADHSVVKAFWF
ncbi:DUF1877 family protein [Kitasatospora griseola]|uniref:DUF1877 family protein n=1 Tax=Kitasatospora griseola TaxID=2064 RepID=UPI001E32132E|nr:DUF1877 family protein [Kitasatospora griseola]